ncbi:hypothetical protein FB451DRAFT_1195482 [Mycena latifolia]|nr:hypothetical protein FB451DRAFT_1195482 [Mycena latifolia]
MAHEKLCVRSLPRCCKIRIRRRSLCDLFPCALESSDCTPARACQDGLKPPPWAHQVYLHSCQFMDSVNPERAELSAVCRRSAPDANYTAGISTAAKLPPVAIRRMEEHTGHARSGCERSVNGLTGWWTTARQDRKTDDAHDVRQSKAWFGGIRVLKKMSMRAHAHEVLGRKNSQGNPQIQIPRAESARNSGMTRVLSQGDEHNPKKRWETSTPCAELQTTLKHCLEKDIEWREGRTHGRRLKFAGALQSKSARDSSQVSQRSSSSTHLSSRVISCDGRQREGMGRKAGRGREAGDDGRKQAVIQTPTDPPFELDREQACWQQPSGVIRANGRQRAEMLKDELAAEAVAAGGGCAAGSKAGRVRDGQWPR